MQPLKDEIYGNRNGGVKGPCANERWIAAHVEDVTPEEIARRMANARDD